MVVFVSFLFVLFLSLFVCLLGEGAKKSLYADFVGVWGGVGGGGGRGEGGGGMNIDCSLLTERQSQFVFMGDSCSLHCVLLPGREREAGVWNSVQGEGGADSAAEQGGGRDAGQPGQAGARAEQGQRGHRHPGQQAAPAGPREAQHARQVQGRAGAGHSDHEARGGEDARGG